MTQGSFTIGVFTSTEGEVVNFYAGGDTGNSMFKENSKWFDNDVPIQKTTLTVDGVVRRSGIQKPVDILKLDSIQGAELLALKGATKVLSEATFVQVEASTITYNEGAPCHFHVDAFLREKGFFFYDFAGQHYDFDTFKTGGVGQFDALYIRPSSDRIPTEMKDAKFCTGENTPPTTILDQVNGSAVLDMNMNHNSMLQLMVGF